MKNNNDGYFVMTITPLKVPKNKVLQWIFWNVYWRVWKVWRLKLIAFIFGELVKIFDKIRSNTNK